MSRGIRIASCFMLSFFFYGCATMPEKADLTVVHLSDLHLDTDGKITDTRWTYKIELGGYKLHKPCTGKSFELLERAVGYINSKVKPDVLVVTEDIVNRSDDVAAMRKGRDIIDTLKCSYIVARGDHEFPRKAGEDAFFDLVFGKLRGKRMGCNVRIS